MGPGEAQGLETQDCHPVCSLEKEKMDGGPEEAPRVQSGWARQA